MRVGGLLIKLEDSCLIHYFKVSIGGGLLVAGVATSSLWVLRGVVDIVLISTTPLVVVLLFI